jgi:hypothetical protein
MCATCGEGTANLPGHLSSLPVFSGIRNVTKLHRTCLTKKEAKHEICKEKQCHIGYDQT